MSRPVSRAAIVGALLKKELRAYSRDTIYLLLTLVVIVALPIVFRFLPQQVDETITLAVAPPISTLMSQGAADLKELGATDEQLAELQSADLSEEQEGLLLLEFEQAEQMRDVIDGKLEAWRTDSGELVLRDPEGDDDEPANAEKVDIGIGIAFPEGFIGDVAARRDNVEVTVYSDAGVPDEIRGAMTSFVREVGYQLAGRELPVTMPDEGSIVLGEDRAGEQVSVRDKMRPMFLFVILMMETFSMASLVSTEVLQRTVTAVLVTPAKVVDFLAAKTIFGTAMSLGQALLVLLLLGGLTASNWSLVLVTLLIGAVIFTGIAMFVGSAGKDFIGQLFYAMLFTIPLLIPAFSVLFPGSAAPWVQALPTYPVLDVLVRSFNYNATWADSWRSLAYAAAWLVVLFGAGVFTLRKKVQSL